MVGALARGGLEALPFSLYTNKQLNYNGKN